MKKEEIKVLVVEDESSQREVIGDILSDEGYSVRLAESGDVAITLLEKESYQVVVTDLKMPGASGLDVLNHALAADENTVVVMLTAYGTVETAVQAMKKGATDYLSKPLRKDELLIVLEKALRNRRLAQENIDLHRQLENRYHFDKIIGSSEAMNEIYRLIGKVVDNDSTVLINGESGTGKELVARAIHFNGLRRRGPFVAVNCAAIPENLIESELFGHEKGAFSGATGRRIGKFEQADKGTIFLDEISTLQYGLQAKFLRVLQEREFQRVGGDSVIKADVRIITATNQNLRKMAGSGKFRDDLYHRLNVVNINLPPLRERKDDIPLLVKSFLGKYCEKYEKPDITISLEAVEALSDYEWPGNVRELENMIEQLVVLSDGPKILPSDLPSYIFDGMVFERLAESAKSTEEKEQLCEHSAVKSGVDSVFRLPSSGIEFSVMEKSLICQALEQAGGRLVKAAKLLGISYKTLQYRIKKHRIDLNSIQVD